MSWLPEGFEHPQRVDLATGHHLRPIRGSDVDIDYPAMMGSRERLWAKYGEAWGWPAETITYEADREDLERHAEEIKRHETFNYAVLDADETQLLGCVYIDPPDERSAPGADAVSSWLGRRRRGRDGPRASARRLRAPLARAALGLTLRRLLPVAETMAAPARDARLELDECRAVPTAPSISSADLATKSRSRQARTSSRGHWWPWGSRCGALQGSRGHVCTSPARAPRRLPQDRVAASCTPAKKRRRPRVRLELSLSDVVGNAAIRAVTTTLRSPF